MNIVLLFPGQGSQSPGMAHDLVQAHDAARDVFLRGDEALGFALSDLAFSGPDTELTLTRNAQPALLLHGAAVLAVLAPALGGRVVAAAGHSLGEFTAYHAAGSLTLEAGARLVRRRGELMQETGETRPGAMAAILGNVEGGIEAVCERASAEADVVVPANYNSAVQVVVSGSVAGVERAMELAREAGAKRTVRLNVSGAFHSPLMEPAARGLEAALEAAGIADAAFPVWSNVSAQPVQLAADARRLLHQQLTSPVRWTDIMEGLAAAHPDALFLEMGPGNVLTGLMKRAAPGVRIQPCGTAAEVDAIASELA